MRGRIKATEPSKIEFDVVITATAAEWEKLRGELSKAANTSEVYRMNMIIDDVLAQARRVFWAAEAKEPERCSA